MPPANHRVLSCLRSVVMDVVACFEDGRLRRLGVGGAKSRCGTATAGSPALGRRPAAAVGTNNAPQRRLHDVLQPCFQGCAFGVDGLLHTFLHVRM